MQKSRRQQIIHKPPSASRRVKIFAPRFAASPVVLLFFPLMFLLTEGQLPLGVPMPQSFEKPSYERAQRKKPHELCIKLIR